MDKHDFSARRRVWGGAMKGLMVLCAALTCALAAFLILYVLAKGIPNLSWKLLTTKPSYLEGTIGILPDILLGRLDDFIGRTGGNKRGNDVIINTDNLIALSRPITCRLNQFFSRALKMVDQ